MSEPTQVVLDETSKKQLIEETNKLVLQFGESVAKGTKEQTEKLKNELELKFSSISKQNEEYLKKIEDTSEKLVTLETKMNELNSTPLLNNKVGLNFREDYREWSKDLKNHLLKEEKVKLMITRDNLCAEGLAKAEGFSFAMDTQKFQPAGAIVTQDPVLLEVIDMLDSGANSFMGASRKINMNTKTGRIRYKLKPPKGFIRGEGQKTEVRGVDYEIRQVILNAIAYDYKATQELVEFAEVDLKGVITSEVAEGMEASMMDLFLYGDGVNKPQGLLMDREIEVVKTGTAGKVTSSDILTMIGKLESRFKRASLYISKATWIDMLVNERDQNGRPIHENQYFQIMPQGQITVPSLGATPTIFLPELPKYTTPSNYASGDKIAFVSDLSLGYCIFSIPAITMMTDPYSESDSRVVVWRFDKYVDGCTILKEATKILTVA